ncbi:D-alanyl-D-alanine dipeptidase, partial [Streptomyces sp. NPDC059909]
MTTADAAYRVLIVDDDAKMTEDLRGLLTEELADLGVIQIRYFTPHNFVGERIDGYREPLCILTKP